jgi:hypothetical protein
METIDDFLSEPVSHDGYTSLGIKSSGMNPKQAIARIKPNGMVDVLASTNTAAYSNVYPDRIATSMGKTAFVAQRPDMTRVVDTVDAAGITTTVFAEGDIIAGKAITSIPTPSEISGPAISGSNLAAIVNLINLPAVVLRDELGVKSVVADTMTTIAGSDGPLVAYSFVAMDRSAADPAMAIKGETASGQGVVFEFVAAETSPVAIEDVTLIPNSPYSGVAARFTVLGDTAYDPLGDLHITAFTGFGPEGQHGIYASQNGVLKKVFDIFDAIDGKTPAMFSIGDHSFDLGVLSFVATFTDASQGLYTVNLPSLFLRGDYNGDGVVDAADYVTIRKGLGTIYTLEHYDEWRSNFGQSLSTGTNDHDSPAVPEPSSLLLAAGMLSAILVRRRARR